jgi:hypothetical protein
MRITTGSAVPAGAFEERPAEPVLIVEADRLDRDFTRARARARTCRVISMQRGVEERQRNGAGRCFEVRASSLTIRQRAALALGDDQLLLVALHHPRLDVKTSRAGARRPPSRRARARRRGTRAKPAPSIASVPHRTPYCGRILAVL